KPVSSGSKRALWINMNRRAGRDYAPERIHVLIRQGDAAVGPVATATVGIIRGFAMNHDGAAGINAIGLGPGDIFGVGVGDVDGAIEQAVGIAPVKHVGALGSARVTALALVANRLLAEADREAFHHDAAGVQVK